MYNDEHDEPINPQKNTFEGNPAPIENNGDSANQTGSTTAADLLAERTQSEKIPSTQVLEEKIAELQEAFLRAKAEGENIRRRAQEDIGKAHKFAVEAFAENLLAVKDSLEISLALENVSVETLKEGVAMTLKQLSTAFEKNRLLEINPGIGEKLDPLKHQAISTAPAEQAPNTIVTVLQKGYTIADRLLRPALVVVAAAK